MRLLFDFTWYTLNERNSNITIYKKILETFMSGSEQDGAELTREIKFEKAMEAKTTNLKQTGGSG